MVLSKEITETIENIKNNTLELETDKVNIEIIPEEDDFFEDDNFEHMACGVIADWGEIGQTEIRICDLEDLKKCEIFRKTGLEL